MERAPSWRQPPGNREGHHTRQCQERGQRTPEQTNTLTIAVMVFQLRVVTGVPKRWSNVPR